jgi:UDP-N-acetylmuramoyl-tripeptide--D-alanyl-D-alanine ligase
MIPLTVNKLAEIIKSKTIPAVDSRVKTVSIDSRNIPKGCVFFAVKGENHDGHDYAEKAIESGAVCAVVQKEIPGVDKSKLLVVDDVIATMGRLASFVRRHSEFKVVAITGSAGKTTTKNMLSAVLDSKFRYFSSPKSFNNNIGVPLTIFSAPADCEIVISELGTNHIGEIEVLSKMIEPDIAMITTVCPAHLEGFGSLDAIVKEKVSITAGLKKDGKFFINGNRKELLDYCKKNNLKFTTFGTTSDCDISVDNIKLTGDKSLFTVEGVEVNLPLIGKANVENASACLAVAKHFGFSAVEFADAISKIKPVAMRMEILQFGTLAVISDCYNANPGSMENALQSLALMAGQRGKRPVFIFGKMGELGGESQRLHIELGRQITQYKIPISLTIAGDAALAAETARKIGRSDNTAVVFENLDELTDNLPKFVKPDDIVLVKASRSQRFEKVVDKLKGLFGQ